MTDTQHTPGPWEVRERDDFLECFKFITDLPSKLIYWVSLPTDEDRANANLIAAAPDYDAASRMAVEGAAPLNADESDHGPVIIEREAYDALRAAIAKAKAKAKGEG